jgi:hypothetical protein
MDISTALAPQRASLSRTRTSGRDDVSLYRFGQDDLVSEFVERHWGRKSVVCAL